MKCLEEGTYSVFVQFFCEMISLQQDGLCLLIIFTYCFFFNMILFKQKSCRILNTTCKHKEITVEQYCPRSLSVGCLTSSSKHFMHFQGKTKFNNYEIYQQKGWNGTYQGITAFDCHWKMSVG